MENPAISVVVPIYNQEKYLGKCIQSVLSQSFRDFEVILVNDGSTDRSLEICQKYAQKDKRVSIINKSNEGVTFARRDGLLQAKGKYVCFVDSDDYLDPYALEILHTIASQHHVDTVIGNYDRVFDNWGLLVKKSDINPLADRKLERDELLAFFIGSGTQQAAFLWGRLYRLDCFKKSMEVSYDLLFPPGIITGEDRFLNLALAPFLGSLWVTNDILYHYRFGGMTSKYFPLIKDGGRFFDESYEMCWKYQLDHLLSDVFNCYKRDFYFDVRLQIRYHICSDMELRDFVEKELNTRKIMLWAQKHLPDSIKQKKDVRALLEHDTEKIIEIVKQEEKRLRKHYLMTRILKLFQRLEGVIR